MAVQYCDYEIKGTLNTTGVITAPGGTSTQWNTSYDNMITGLAVTGTTTKTLTATQQDGGTITASWADDSGSNNYLTSLSFNTGNGILTAARQGLSSVTVDLDGRYVTSSGVTSVNFKTDGTALNVASNTITGSGTMTGIWQGTASEYVNGLGDRVTFPTIPQGDITSVNAGTNLNGGGTSGAVTLNLDAAIELTSVQYGSGVTLSESSDRADLLYINSSTSTWGGLQIGNTSNEFIFSLMGDGNVGGIYDDQNADWIIQWTENSGISLYYNAGQKLTTTNTGVTITGTASATTFNGALSGNATTATTLQTARTIAGVSFNGSANISLNNNAITNGAGYITSSSIPSVGNGTFTVTGNTGLSGSGSMTANQSGNSSATLINTDRGSSQAIYKNFTASSGGTATANSNNDTLTIAAGTNITTVRSGDTITINATNDGQGVTSVGTSGTVSGLTLTGGTITSTGTITLGGTLSLTSANVTSGLGFTPYNATNPAGYTTNTGTTTASNTQTFTNKSGNISQWTNDSGYITSSSIPSVGNGTLTVQGTGVLGGSGTFTANQSGNSTISVTHDNSGATAGAYTNANVTVNATGHVTSISSGSDAQGVTSIATGSGISGGTITSTGTLTVGAGNGLSQSSTGLLMSGSYTGDFTASGDITIGGRDLIFSNTGTNDANITSSLGINFIVAPSGISGLEIDSAGGVTTYNVLTTGGSIIVGGGGIQLNGTGRIQGVDTVSASTDAANKAYVDAHPDGTVTSVGLTSQGDAIAIIGTPVTTSGNLGITFQGDTSDYINGEGDLEAFPNIPQGTITGGGAASRVAFWSGATSLSGDINLYWDGTNDRLGVGTSTPSVPLHVVGTLRAGGSSDYIELRDNGNIMLADSSCAIAPIYTGTASNTLSIGFTMTGVWNTINHHFSNEVAWNPGILGAADAMNLSNTGDLLIKGDVGIGTTAPLEKLQVDGNAAIYGAIKGYTGSSSNQYLSILQSGTQTFISTGTTGETVYFGIGPVTNVTNISIAGTATATNFILSSDKTLKDKIKNIKTNHVDVKWKNFELISEPGVKRSGVIAQELEVKHPEFIRTDKDGLKSVAYIDLLITKIAELEARLEKAGL